MSSTVEIGGLYRSSGSFWRLSGCSLLINLFAVDCIEYSVILEITNNASAETTQ